MNSITLTFADDISTSIDIDKIVDISYIVSALNFKKDTVGIPFPSKYFLSLLSRKNISSFTDDDATICVNMVDYLGWNSIRNYLLVELCDIIDIKTLFPILHSWSTSMSRSVIKQYRDHVYDLFTSFDRSTLLDVCKLFQHTDLYSIVKYVNKWAIKHNDNTIWNDIANYRYGIDDNTVMGFIRDGELCTHEVVANNMKSLRIWGNGSSLYSCDISLSYGLKIKSRYNNIFIKSDESNFNLTITAIRDVTLAIISDSTIYVELREDEKFEYLAGYHQSCVNIHIIDG